LIEFHETLRKLSSLRKELEILKPDAVVFFTGPRFDYTLSSLFQTASFRSAGGDEQYLHYLKAFRGSGLILRTYHPNYLIQKKRSSIIKEIVTLIKHEFDLASISIRPDSS